MIELIEGSVMGWNTIPIKCIVDKSLTPKRGQPVFHRFNQPGDFGYWGWRFIDHWDGNPTNNIILSVIMILK